VKLRWLHELAQWRWKRGCSLEKDELRAAAVWRSSELLLERPLWPYPPREQQQSIVQCLVVAVAEGERELQWAQRSVEQQNVDE
jgi:hypothetical protein